MADDSNSQDGLAKTDIPSIAKRYFERRRKQAEFDLVVHEFEADPNHPHFYPASLELQIEEQRVILDFGLASADETIREDVLRMSEALGLRLLEYTANFDAMCETFLRVQIEVMRYKQYLTDPRLKIEDYKPEDSLLVDAVEVGEREKKIKKGVGRPGLNWDAIRGELERMSEADEIDFSDRGWRTATSEWLVNWYIAEHKQDLEFDRHGKRRKPPIETFRDKLRPEFEALQKKQKPQSGKRK